MRKTFVRPCRARSVAEPAAAHAGRSLTGPVSDRILENLYRREGGALLRYLKRRVGHELAPDIAQEVFLRASSSRLLPDLANPGGFLHRIAINILIDRQRRTRCRIPTLPLAENIDAPCPPEQEWELEACDLRSSLARALAALPQRTRTIFVMHRFDELSYREIERKLGLSASAVEYHMMKALAHVRATVRLPNCEK